MKRVYTLLLLLLFFTLRVDFLLAQQTTPTNVVLGNARTAIYLPLLQGKRVALFSNHTGMVGDKHLLDLLLEEGINVVSIFSPEHGFRGGADAGEKVANSIDARTGVPIHSLYGRKGGMPTAQEMEAFDILVVDIQDVGLRYYTYYITLCKLMDICAQHNRHMVLLDRPNPNGHYVDGPRLNMHYKSGVGWLPIPIVHGMTLGELAQMVNGEGWLPKGRNCSLTVIPCLHYTHATHYELPIAPSPNLPTMKAVYLYASLCFFEGTPISLGRGTELPFQCYGHPQLEGYTYHFTPRSKEGAKYPPQQDKRCYGADLSQLSDSAIWAEGIDLSYLIDAYTHYRGKESFFTPFFELLVGQSYVREMIVAGKRADEIEARWQEDVEAFRQERRAYLLYPE